MLTDYWLLFRVKDKETSSVESGRVKERKLTHGGACDAWYYSLKVKADCFESPGFVELWDNATLHPFTCQKKKKILLNSQLKEKSDARIWPRLLMFKEHFLKGTNRLFIVTQNLPIYRIFKDSHISILLNLNMFLTKSAHMLRGWTVAAT